MSKVLHKESHSSPSNVSIIVEHQVRGAPLPVSPGFVTLRSSHRPAPGPNRSPKLRSALSPLLYLLRFHRKLGATYLGQSLES